ncbi:unnamed protein product, partial [Gulo gulo]
VGHRVRKSRAGAGVANKRYNTGPTPDSRARGAARAWAWAEKGLGTEPHAGAEFGTGTSLNKTLPYFLPAGSFFAALGICNWPSSSVLRF